MKEAAVESKKRGEKSISAQAVRAVTEVRHVMACSPGPSEFISMCLETSPCLMLIGVEEVTHCCSWALLMQDVL